MLIDFWHRLFVTAFLIIGAWTLFRKEMLLGNLGEWCYKHLPQMLYKPTMGCPPCMSSFYGSFMWFYMDGDLKMWIPFLLALCGLMKLITIEFLSRP